FFFHRVEERLRRLFVDANRPIALNVRVAADRAKAGSRATYITAQEKEVRDLADRRDRVAMLRNAHRPGADRARRFDIDFREAFELLARHAGLIFDLIPARRIDCRAVSFETSGVLLQECTVEK